MKKIYWFIEDKRFRTWVQILSFCLFSSLVSLLLFHPEGTARKLGLYGLLIWMGDYSFELARWLKASDKNKN